MQRNSGHPGHDGGTERKGRDARNVLNESSE